MTQTYETPACEAGARGDLLGGGSLHPYSPVDWRAQLLAGRYCLPITLARAVADHAFGGGAS